MPFGKMNWQDSRLRGKLREQLWEGSKLYWELRRKYSEYSRLVGELREEIWEGSKKYWVCSR
jgi:hypothetical protein